MCGSTPINQLNSLSSISSSDKLPIYSNVNGDSMEIPISVLQSYLQSNLTFSGSTFETVYSTPVTGGTISDIATATSDQHIIITPAGTLSTLTITMPLVPGATDKQEILVNCTQAITTLTLSTNGATAVVGAPSSLSANDYFRLKYDALMTTWYRVG